MGGASLSWALVRRIRTVDHAVTAVWWSTVFSWTDNGRLRTGSFRRGQDAENVYCRQYLRDGGLDRSRSRGSMTRIPRVQGGEGGYV
jgi:hypothetical protein